MRKIFNECAYDSNSAKINRRAYQKMQEKNNGVPKKDYANANMQPGQVILSTLWASVVVVFAYDLVTGVAEGRYGRVEGSLPTDLLHGNLWSLPF